MEKFKERVSGAGVGWNLSIYKEDTYRSISCTHLATDIHGTSGFKKSHAL